MRNYVIIILSFLFFLGGCGSLLYGPQPRVISVTAVPLPRISLLLSVGQTTTYEVINKFGQAGDVISGGNAKRANPACDEILVYYPRTTEIVYLVTIKSNFQGYKNYKFAPSNGLTLAMCFSRDKFVNLL